MRRKDPGHFALFAKRLRQDSNLLPPASKGVAPLSTASASIQPVTSIEGHGGHSDGLPPRGAQRTLRSGTPAGPKLGLQGPSFSVPALLTVREAAARLRVSTATVYALCERGELRHVRVSNAIRLRVEDLEDFIRRGGRVDAK